LIASLSFNGLKNEDCGRRKKNIVEYGTKVTFLASQNQSSCETNISTSVNGREEYGRRKILHQFIIFALQLETHNMSSCNFFKRNKKGKELYAPSFVLDHIFDSSRSCFSFLFPRYV